MGGQIQTNFSGPLTWQGYRDWMGNKKKKRLGHETTAYRYERPDDQDVIAIEHYRTDIMTYYPDGCIKIANHGYDTASTKVRFEQFGPFWIWSKNGQWTISKLYDRYKYIFEDGFVFYPSAAETQHRWLLAHIEEAHKLIHKIENDSLWTWNYRSDLNSALSGILRLDFWEGLLAELLQEKPKPPRFPISKKNFFKVYTAPYWEDIKQLYGKKRVKEMLYERFVTDGG